jgi:hypothetical protein
MVTSTKLYSRLDALEAELREVFMPHLRSASEGKNDLIFCVNTFNSFRDLKDKTDKVTEESIDISSQILSLREKLGEPTQGTIAELICKYCRKWSSTKKYHKSFGTDLAKKFLAEVEDERNLD